MKKPVDPKKMVGMARDVDGVYRPTNERQVEKLKVIYGAAGVPQPWRFDVRQNEMRLLGDLAKAAGFKLFTTGGRFFPV